MDAIEDLTPEWINELHERLDEQGLSDLCHGHSGPDGVQARRVSRPGGTQRTEASWMESYQKRRWVATVAGCFLRGERENVTKRTFRHQI